jgi:hypothetical protein
VWLGKPSPALDDAEPLDVIRRRPYRMRSCWRARRPSVERPTAGAWKRVSPASAFSAAGSSLAHSRASRARLRRRSFSATATSIALLRLVKQPAATKRSSWRSVARSSVTVTFAAHWLDDRVVPLGSAA